MVYPNFPGKHDAPALMTPVRLPWNVEIEAEALFALAAVPGGGRRESMPDQGSTFSVALPAELGRDAPARAA